MKKIGSGMLMLGLLAIFVSCGGDDGTVAGGGSSGTTVSSVCVNSSSTSSLPSCVRTDMSYE